MMFKRLAPLLLVCALGACQKPEKPAAEKKQQPAATLQVQAKVPESSPADNEAPKTPDVGSLSEEAEPTDDLPATENTDIQSLQPEGPEEDIFREDDALENDTAPAAS
jgi:hypothetical protein